MNSDIAERRKSNAEILVWQSSVRIIVACIVAVAELLLSSVGAQSSAVSRQAASVILLATVAYAALVAIVAVVGRRRGALPNIVVLITLVSDIAFVFIVTIALSVPTYYDRILIFAFFALHLTTFYFGRRYAATLLAITAVGYLSLVRVSIAAGAPLRWFEELWSLGAFALAGVLLLIEHGSLRNRLGTLVRLFGRAQEGDFTEAYDEESDARPDSISRVGEAYNRVRGQLASMVLTDPLTGCLNRRGFDQALAREIARVDRAGSELALLALDIDHFKAVNDTLGHPAGDEVLREIGALLLRLARAGDVVARTGGEEFALVLPDTSAPAAYQVASRLCSAIRANQFTAESSRLYLTVSIGVVGQDPAVQGTTFHVAETLKGRADEALYSAKRGGRDRVRVWAASDKRESLDAMFV